jgi:hypothetical protein
MDYRQFIQILKDESDVPNSVSMLNEFVNEFPYFQTAHSLLAREMFRQQHIRYEKQLKIAAAYSPDRKALYNLVHPKKTNIFSTEPIVEHPDYVVETADENQPQENLFDIESDGLIPPVDATVEEPKMPAEELLNNNEENYPSNFESASIEPVVMQTPHFEETFQPLPDEPESYFEEELPPSDPHEIIRRRLNEILGLARAEANEPVREIKTDHTTEEPQPPKVEANIYENGDIDESPRSIQEDVKDIHADTFSEIPAEIKSTEPGQEKDDIEKIADQSGKAIDEIDKAELEHALEASLLQSLEKLPLMEKHIVFPVREEKTHDEPASFLDWLRKKSPAGFGIVEEVRAYDEAIVQEPEIQPGTKTESNALIERFIKEDPRIVASKAEFYSPAIQAKRSITEDEDLVSETLAGIYRNQGNHMKARSMYEKLGLLFPEKRAYFAALISEIDSEINQQQKEDL